jgi:hypothetical protein
LFSGLVDACSASAKIGLSNLKISLRGNATLFVSDGFSLHVALIFAGQTTQACKPGASKATMSFLFDSGYYEVGKNGVSPFHVFVTNPLSRLEVIMQTNSLKGNSISTVAALKELSTDMAKFGLAGAFQCITQIVAACLRHC